MRLLLILLALPAQAADPWWVQRHEKGEGVYPHRAHEAVMARRGDPCLRCHPFLPWPEDLPEAARPAWRTLANEPLAAICHQCHLRERSAPDACELCHRDVAALRPPSHTPDYARAHAADARAAEADCGRCHLDGADCDTCHRRRDAARRAQHPPGYVRAHGLAARLDAESCGACHGPGYCADCHRRRGLP